MGEIGDRCRWTYDFADAGSTRRGWLKDVVPVERDSLSRTRVASGPARRRVALDLTTTRTYPTRSRMAPPVALVRWPVKAARSTAGELWRLPDCPTMDCGVSSCTTATA
jgi:hypothetical protein